MINPASGPALRPSPMDVGAVVAGTVEVFRRRFGLFVLLTVAPVALVLALGGGLIAIGTTFRNSLVSDWDVRAQSLVGFAIAYVVLAAASIMAQLKFGSMTSAAVAEVVEGGHPTLEHLWARTRGVTARVIVVVLVYVLAAVALITLSGIFLVVLVRADGRGDDAAAAVAVLAFVAISPVLLVVGAYFGTRWLYVLPVAAIERASGARILGRSWALTRGAFWRTFGFNLIAVLMVNALSTAASIPLQTADLQLAATLGNAARASTPSEVVGMLFALPATLLLTLALSSAVQLITMPFLLIYQTVMYLDQVGRVRLFEAGVPCCPTQEQPLVSAVWPAPAVPQPRVYQPPTPQPPMSLQPTSLPPFAQPPMSQPPMPQPPMPQPPMSQPPMPQPPRSQPARSLPPTSQPPAPERTWEAPRRSLTSDPEP